MLLEDIVIKQENKVSELNKSIVEVMKVINKKEEEINQDKIYINNLKELIKDLKKEFNNTEQKNKNNNKKLINLQIQLNYLKNGVNNFININNNNGLNNMNNKKYSNKNNNSINYLHKNNSSRNYNLFKKESRINKRLINIKSFRSLFEESNKTKTLIGDNDKKTINVPKILNMNKYKIINNKKNKKINIHNNISLPNLDEYKRKNKIKKYIIFDGRKNNLKSQIIKNDNPIFGLLNIPNLEKINHKNSSISKIYEKHLNSCKKEEHEKQQIDEFKDLLDKIVSDFET